MSDTITIPVTATMSKQPDGSFKMTQATYISVEADTVARFLLEHSGLSVKEAGA